jgi:hypothetical protein
MCQAQIYPLDPGAELFAAAKGVDYFMNWQGPAERIGLMILRGI